MLIHLDGDGVALFDIVVQIRLLDQKKAVIDGVAEKIRAKDFAITQEMPSALMISGACSLEEPQPKFFPATMMSPFQSVRPVPGGAGKSRTVSYRQLSLKQDTRSG